MNSTLHGMGSDRPAAENAIHSMAAPLEALPHYTVPSNTRIQQVLTQMTSPEEETLVLQAP